MLYTSEQFANRQFMESHDGVALGATSRQTETRTSSSRSSTDNDEYLREASRLIKKDSEIG